MPQDVRPVVPQVRDAGGLLQEVRDLLLRQGVALRIAQDALPLQVSMGLQRRCAPRRVVVCHTSGDHAVGIEVDAQTPTSRFRKGRWHYGWARDVDHLDICVLPQPDQIGWQRQFYISLFERLAELKVR